MKRTLYTGALLLMLAGLCQPAMAQNAKTQQPNQKQQKKLLHGFYRRNLGVDSAKAEQVARVQEAYKAGIKSLMADTSLNDAGRRAKVRALIEAKNQKLGQLLTPAQQAKMVPTTEHAQTKKEQ